MVGRELEAFSESLLEPDVVGRDTLASLEVVATGRDETAGSTWLALGAAGGLTGCPGRISGPLTLAGAGVCTIPLAR